MSSCFHRLSLVPAIAVFLAGFVGAFVALRGAGLSTRSGTETLQRFSLLGGEGVACVISSTRQRSGSSGISIECHASPAEQLVFRSTVIPTAGAWALRIDDGALEPRWMSGAGEVVVRVTGSGYYRFLIYSDDVGASASIRDVTITHASDADRCVELAWPQSGPIVEAETAASLAAWRAHFGLSDSEGDEASAVRVTSWVHGRSRVVDRKSPSWSTFGSPCVSESGVASSIDGTCGTFANALLQALSKVNIVSRLVCLGSKRFELGEELGDTHALVEVFDRSSERWVLVDPTFNVQFVDDDGKSLGIAELMTIQTSGGKWALHSIAPPLPGRSATEYYLPFRDLLWVADAPAVPGLGARGAMYQSRDQTVSEIIRAKYGPTLGGSDQALQP